jgi:putative ABC transport system permease protein
LAPGLKEGAAVTRRSRLPGVLVIAQVASCVVLLVAATLLVRSVANIYRGPGFNPDGVVLMRLRPSLVGQTAERAAAFQREAIQRLLTIPGVSAASPALYPPLPDWGGRHPLWRPGERPAPGGAGFTTSMNAVGPGFLRTIELPLVAGRDFDDGDRPDGPRVAIVNEIVARGLWPGGSALDSRFVLDGDEYRVIGIVKAAQYHSAGAAPDPLVFVDYWQMKSVGRVPIDSRTHVRVERDARRMLPQLRREMLALDPTVPISEDRPLSEWLDYSFRPVRAAAAAVVCFAALALVLSVVGLYAVVAANAAHRTREIAVRLALGASRADVRRLVLGHGLALTAAGIVLGTAGALVVARLLAAYLYGVGERDPIALAAAAALLALTALAASYVPAHRAMAVDPIQSLRNYE